jgi:glycosyltransferase involved in cell wall biosynthesis
MKTLSLVMIVRNEEKLLGRCLESVKHIVDEVIVVDTGSEDSTKEIAAAFGAKVFDYKWTYSFSEARNFALQQSTSDWNMVLDADEFFVEDYKDEIRKFIDGYAAIGRIKRLDKFRGKDGDSYAQTFISRLFPRDLRYVGSIHEQIESSLPRVKLRVEIQHDGYYDQIRSDRNIPLLLREIESSPQNDYYHYQIAKEYRGLEKHDLAYYHLSQSYLFTDKSMSYFPNVVVDYIYAGMACGELNAILNVINAENKRLADFADFHFASGLFYLEIIMNDPSKHIHLLQAIENCYRSCLLIGETNKYDSVAGTGSYSAMHNLGVYYEVIGQSAKAVEYYRKAATYKYEPSLARLEALHIV